MDSGAVTSATSTAVRGASESSGPAKAERHFRFADLLDVINPLQHIPVISTIYRRLTGDTMSAPAEIAGGALFGGVIGAVASLANVIWADRTGKDFGETIASWLGFGRDRPTELTALPASTSTTHARHASPQPEAVPGLSELQLGMRKRGIDPELASRAAFAYQSATKRKDRLVASLIPASSR